MTGAATFPALLERFFTDRLLRQRQASPNTVASYRDTFRLLVQFARQRLTKAPCELSMADLDTPFLGAFLDDLECTRGNAARSRNVRLAAIHSFFRYVALHEPQYLGLAQRVLAMPSKRFTRSPLAYLTDEESEALVAAPDTGTWVGRRDRTLLLLAIQTGLVSGFQEARKNGELTCGRSGGLGPPRGAPTGQGSERHGVAGVEEVALGGILQGDVVFALELLDAQTVAGPDVLA